MESPSRQPLLKVTNEVQQVRHNGKQLFKKCVYFQMDKKAVVSQQSPDHSEWLDSILIL
jgi:tagatose-1,6-bisphosphate aldolase